MMSKPVFLHSGWRAGSTYLWSKFRRLERYLAFYEPFHESLASMTVEHARSFSEPARVANRHPELDRPYFIEYEPLIDGAGVRHFEERFAIATYFADQEPLEAQQAYISGLIGLAEAQGKTAVLGYVRSLGRLPWLRRRFDAVNILLVRDPVQQWASGEQQRTRGGNPYFHIMPYMVLGEAPDYAARTGCRVLPHLNETFDRRLARHVEAFGGDAPGESLRVFMHYHLLTHLAACNDCDLIVDIDLLSADQQYRSAVTERIESLTGARLDFEDARVGDNALESLNLRVAPALDDFVRLHLSARLPRSLDASGEREASGFIVEKMCASLLTAVLRCGAASKGALERTAAETGNRDAVEGLRLAFDEIQYQRGELEAANRNIAALQQAKTALQSCVASLEQHIEAIHASTSWRVTAPMRSIREALRRHTRKNS